MVWRTVRNLRYLAIDIENKPGTYGPGDYTHPKVTAIGWGWRGDTSNYKGSSRVFGMTLDRRDVKKMREVAESFRAAWDDADFIVAHNGRRHDRKILDGLYWMLDLPLLSKKRILDTYLDVEPKPAGLSRSLENLSARWECPINKPHLEEHVWEAAYDGVDWAVNVMRRRVMADVRISLWLLEQLVERKLLILR